MPKSSREVTAHRREEIIDACAELYSTMPYCEVTMKKIAEKTTFSRPSIYNYFETMGEIFLALLSREYDLWTADLTALAETHERLTAEELSCGIAHSLFKRGTMLKIQSVNLYDIENTSRTERLVEFKRCYFASVRALYRCLGKYRPDMTEEEMEAFCCVFFPYLQGVYPFTTPSGKQCAAMKEAGIPFRSCGLYEAVRACVMRLLK